MLTGKTRSITKPMIYLGTLLISILSFFTTLYGMAIIVDFRLAVIGSLGLQLAMLGIAWNIMRIKQSKIPYVIVFSTAAFFSMFFSYANFDSRLKEKTRTIEARGEYNAAARPVLEERLNLAGQALLKGRYQVGRLDHLIELEREKGWSVLVDEGSKDQFVQSIIEGARETVESWESHRGQEYHQGKGRGIIYDYLESQVNHAGQNLAVIGSYIAVLDSVFLALHSGLPVKDQYELVAEVVVRFPLAGVGMILGETPQLRFFPPLPADYPESAANSQHALAMVIDDLFDMDRLTLFSVLLAVAIDAIIILMALAGGRVTDRLALPFERLDRAIDRRTRRLPLDDADAVSRVFAENIRQYRGVNDYARELTAVFAEQKKIKDSHIRRLRSKPKHVRPVKIEHAIGTGQRSLNRVLRLLRRRVGAPPESTVPEPLRERMRVRSEETTSNKKVELTS